VPKAGHAESWNVDPGLYEQRLTAFLARIGATGPRTPVMSFTIRGFAI